jgi:hypothetical protein
MVVIGTSLAASDKEELATVAGFWVVGDPKFNLADLIKPA